MFRLLFNCWSWIQMQQEPIRKVTLLILGLDNAGKTALVRVIQRASPSKVPSMPEPCRTQLHVDRFDVTLIDVAGGQQFRGTWQNYYAEAHGIVFVVDSSDAARLAEARWNLASVLHHPRMSGKPLLLLANKQDKVNTLLPSELIEPLSLEKLVNVNKSLCCIEPCSAVGGLHKVQHWVLLKALRWLLYTIASSYSELCAQVQHDSNLKGSGAHKRPGNADRACSHMQRDRDLQTAKERSQKEGAELPKSKPVPDVKLRSLLPIHKLHSQVLDKEGLKTIKKTKKKPNLKRKGAVNLVEVEREKGRKQGSEIRTSSTMGLLHSNRVDQQSSDSRPKESSLTGPSAKTKMKTKKSTRKNKIKCQEVSGSLRHKELSTFGQWELGDS